MTRLLDDVMSRGFETLRLLITHEGFTTELGEAIRKNGGVDRAISALQKEFLSEGAPVGTKVDCAKSVVSEPAMRWREDVIDGVPVIRLTTTLDKPTSGDKWISRTKKKFNQIGVYAERRVLRSKDFKSSAKGVYEIVILKGLFFESCDRITHKILAKAKTMNLQTPNTDIACLIREQFTDKEIEDMGFDWIVVMHKPIEGCDGYWNLLGVSRCGLGGLLDITGGHSSNEWPHRYGFAFLAQSVS